MRLRYFILICITILLHVLASCRTIAPVNSSVDAVKIALEQDKRLAQELGDQSSVGSISLCLGTIRGLESDIQNLRSALSDCRKHSEDLNGQIRMLLSELADSRMAAGRSSRIDSQVYWIGFLITTLLIGSVFFLVYRGKIRIPGFLG